MIFKKATKFQTSCLQGSIDISYSDLLRVFGKEHERYEEEGLKTDVVWDFEFIMDDGSVIYANIYNWKDGVNYLGPKGKEVEEITDWHIDGNSNQAVQLINTAIKERFNTELRPEMTNTAESAANLFGSGWTWCSGIKVGSK